MNNTVDLLNFAFSVTGLTIAFMSFMLNFFNPYREDVNKKYFDIFFPVLMIYVGSNLFSQIALNLMGSEYASSSTMAIYIESLSSSFLLLLLTGFLLYTVGLDWKKSPVMFQAVFLWAIYFSMLTSTWFSKNIYYISDRNVYHRGPYYPILLIPPVLIMLLDIAVLFYNRNRISKRMRLAFSIYMFVPLICMIIQMFSYGLFLIVIGTSVAAFYMFIFLITDQVLQYIEQKEENAQAFATNMALQMRPHFIYNTMTSIYYLIKQDQEKAQQVTLDFTNYLRRNFTSIAKGDTIPFSEELEHTRAYLAVEEVRFEGALFTEFDTPHTIFRIPPLTLQPIVENSVKHGVDPERDPLTIKVSTAKAENGNMIIIEDNGVGFGNADDNDDPHIALDNISKRLKITCNGTINITPREGGGTRVEVLIPEKMTSFKYGGVF